MSNTQPLQPKVATFGAESGHWYDSIGRLILECPNAKGDKMQATNLRHARKLQLAPGVTSTIKLLHAEQLVQWRIRQAVLAAKTLDQQPDEPDTEYLRRIDNDAATHARDAANEGTRIHAALEMHYRGEQHDSTYDSHVQAVSALLLRECGKDAGWLPESGCIHPWGYGTKADLVSERVGWLVDFKGVDGDQAALDGKRTYDSHAMQLAATRNCIAPELRCAIAYVSRDHPGAVSFVEVPEAELVQGLQIFRCLLGVWQAKNNYTPSWATGAV